MGTIRRTTETLVGETFAQGIAWGLSKLLVPGGVVVMAITAFYNDLLSGNWPWVLIVFLAGATIAVAIWLWLLISRWASNTSVRTPYSLRIRIRDLLEDEGYTITVVEKDPLELKVQLESGKPVRIFYNKEKNRLVFSSMGLKPGNHLKEMMEEMNESNADRFVTEMRIELLRLGMEFEEKKGRGGEIVLIFTITAPTNPNIHDIVDPIGKIVIGSELIHMLYQKEFLERYGSPDQSSGVPRIPKRQTAKKTVV